MFIPVYGAVLAGCIIFYLIYKIITLKLKIYKNEFEVYVDTSGIAQNPPKFIDLVNGKTINFKLGKDDICISQLSITKGLKNINSIVALFNMLRQTMEVELDKKSDKLKQDILKMNIYKKIVHQIYDLSKPFVSNKRRFKKELFNKAKDDFAFILRICEEVIDYWGYVGKLLGLLSQGATLRQMFGEKASWKSVSWDLDGEIEIKPRYGLSTN